jgi:hypothetical protein
MSYKKISIKALSLKLAICRLDKSDKIPEWALASSEFFSLTKTPEELSIVCAEDNVPEYIKSEKSWCVIKVLGPLDFALTGVLSALLKPLAENKISIFAISTFDTDYILVKEENLKKAMNILSEFCS